MCITGSVGRVAKNDVVDVKTVQILLNLNLRRWEGSSPLEVDGRLGDQTAKGIEQFQARVERVAAPTGLVDPDGATLRALVGGLPSALTADKVLGIMIHADRSLVVRYVDSLIAKMAARDIDTPLRQAHFLAQVGHESGELRYTEEIATGDAYEGRRDLGNVEPGDGRRFKGPGLIPLTGRANYQAYGSAIGRDLVSGDNPRMVATDPDLAVDVACWFWQVHGLNALADRDDVELVTRRINGGLNGFEDRKRQLGRARFFLACD